MFDLSLAQLLIPGTERPDVLTMTVIVNGMQLPDTSRPCSIHVSRAANRVPSAIVVFCDGDVATQHFGSSDTDMLTPGQTIEIKAGYHGREKTIFKGIIMQHSVQARQGEPSNIEIECKDEAVKLTTRRRDGYFYEKSDSEIIQEILSGAGFSSSEIDETSYRRDTTSQNQVTNWDFLNLRAEANGLLIIVKDGQFLVKAPDFKQEPKFPLHRGSTIFDFEAEMNANDQYPDVRIQVWNPDTQEIEESSPDGGGGLASVSPPSVPSAASNLGRSVGSAVGLDLPGTPPNLDYSEVMSSDPLTLKHAGALKSEEAQAWAKAQKTKNDLAKSRGRVKFEGTAEIYPGEMLQLVGVGLRHSDKVFITAVEHELSGGAWYTHAQFGMAPTWFSEQFTDISPSPAGGLATPMHGLQIGIVTALENDPEHAHRVRVRLPLINNEGNGAWMRIASQDAGNERGAFWRPEINDEVVVGFFGDDPREAVILGMLNSSAKPAPLEAQDTNHQKGWVTRSQIRFIFDDDKKSVVLETPGGRKLTLDDDAKKIQVEDQNGNKITLNDDGITIESYKNLTLKAAQDFKIEALNITQKASAAFKAEGQSQAELKASGQVVVKGAIVQIN